MWIKRKTRRAIISLFGYDVYYALKHWKDRCLYKNRKHVIVIRVSDVMMVGRDSKIEILGIVDNEKLFKYLPKDANLIIGDRRILRHNGELHVMGVSTGETYLTVYSFLNNSRGTANVRVLNADEYE